MCLLSCIPVCVCAWVYVCVSNTCTCSSCLGRSAGPGKQCLVLSLVFYVPSEPGAQAALCGQEVAGLAPDRLMQLFTTVGHIHVCACLCSGVHVYMCSYMHTCVYLWVCLNALISVCLYCVCVSVGVYVCTVYLYVCVCVRAYFVEQYCQQGLQCPFHFI